MRWSDNFNSSLLKLVTISYISVLSRSLLSSTWTTQLKPSYIRQRLPSSKIAEVFLLESTGDIAPDSNIGTYPPVKEGDIVDSFCRWTNSAFRNLTISPVRNYLEIIPAETNMTFLRKLKSPPQYPGISRSEERRVGKECSS